MRSKQEYIRFSKKHNYFASLPSDVIERQIENNHEYFANEIIKDIQKRLAANEPFTPYRITFNGKTTGTILQFRRMKYELELFKTKNQIRLKRIYPGGRFDLGYASIEDVQAAGLGLEKIKEAWEGQKAA